jgi:hypothetical protein
MPAPYEWVEEPAFTTDWDVSEGSDNATRFRALQFTADYREMVDGDMQAAFIDSFTNVTDTHIDPPPYGPVDFWDEAAPDREPGYLGWLTVDHGSAWTGTAVDASGSTEPDFIRTIGYIELFLDGDVGGVDLGTIPEPPEGMFLEVAGGEVESLELEVRYQSWTDGFGNVPKALPGISTWEQFAGQWFSGVATARVGKLSTYGKVALLTGSTPDVVDDSMLWTVATDPRSTNGTTIANPAEGSWGTDDIDPIDRGFDQLAYLTAPYDGSLVILAGNRPLVESLKPLPGDRPRQVFDLGQVGEGLEGLYFATTTKVLGIHVVGINHATWRWRWVPEGTGLTRLRQRQTLTGSDSWPLRQRQNGGHSGSWPLRQRQTGV